MKQDGRKCDQGSYLMIQSLQVMRRDRLHRWGYGRYREMFNSRQLLGLELSARLISGIHDERVRNALRDKPVGSVALPEYALPLRHDGVEVWMSSPYTDFRSSLIKCESNLLGMWPRGGKHLVGGGGWKNIIGKYSQSEISIVILRLKYATRDAKRGCSSRRRVDRR